MPKKIIYFLIALLCIISLLVSCTATSNNADKSERKLRIGTLKGPTGMGMAKVINDNNDTGKYDIELFGAPEDISAKLISENLDIAAVPVNLAAVINKKTEGKYVIAAINTLGVLHIVENGETVKDISDLEGKTLYATGQASTPEYILNYILEANGLKDKVNIVWKAEHSELAALAASGTVDLAMLPEPHVTTALTKNSSLRTALDLTAEWDKISDGNAVQGCIIVSKAAINESKELIDGFLCEYLTSVQFVNTNISEAAAIIADTGIVPSASVAEKAIPRCNIVYIDGDEMINILSSFYKVLYNANPSSIGGKLPDETLYYKR